MPHKVRIALDAMGGDHGAAVVVPGAELSLARHPEIEFLLFGDRAVVGPLVDARPRLKAASRLIHTDVMVQMHDKPSQALRKGKRKSSMWLAIDAVKKGEADVAVSAGNTGALMVMAKLELRTMPGIDRPAIAAIWPTLKGESIVLDLGASIGADAAHLVNLAAMGSAMATILFGLDRPTVGLLNIGVEEAKGLEEVREAGQILRAGTSRDGIWPQFEYFGFVEGDDIGKGTVDVVVTEGFAGNIALKAAEGTARQMSTLLRQEMSRTLATKLGYLLARPAFRALANKMDPRKSNGGVFLGLNGIVIKSHGGTDGEGFAYAVDRGYDLVRHELLAKIGETLTRHQQETASPRAAHSASGDARERADGASADARERADVERADDTRPEPGSSARAAGGAGS
jgi:phosphate acyltransferase